MKKAERLLDLIAFFLNNKEPVSFEEIRAAFPDDYGEGKPETLARKFERDKADIIKMGLPLCLLIGDEVDKEGYVIDRRQYSLPNLDFEPDELAMLYLAGSAALDMEHSPFQLDLVLALNKIGFVSSAGYREDQIPVPKKHTQGFDQKERLHELHCAVSDKKHLTMSYHGLWRDQITKRKIDPYGLVFRRGVWILVGYCHLRQDVRVFHVDRMQDVKVNSKSPKSPDFEIPVNFKLDSHVAPVLWKIKRHEPVKVILRIEPPVAETVAFELKAHCSRIEEDGQARILHLDATNLDGLCSYVLSLRTKAKVLQPLSLIENIQDALRCLSAGVAP
jgi:proteasome accessory factor B